MEILTVILNLFCMLYLCPNIYMFWQQAWKQENAIFLIYATFKNVNISLRNLAQIWLASSPNSKYINL